MRNLKIVCQGEVCKIDKPPSLFIKTLKNVTPGKDGKCNIFFRFEILATNIPTYVQNLKIICQGEVCKIDKPPSLFIKTLKNVTLGKDGKCNIFFQI